MMGIDGQPMSDGERNYRRLRTVMLGCANLTFNVSDQSGLYGLSGPAKDILAADLGNTSLKIDTIIAASARPFLQALHSPAFFQSERDYKGDLVRFDSSGWLRFPNNLALQLGAVRFVWCEQYAAYVTALVIGAQRAIHAMSAGNALHPAFAAIEGIQAEQSFSQLLEQAGSLLGGVLIGPNEERNGFEILWWHEDFHTARNLRVINPRQKISEVISDLEQELSRRLDTSCSDADIARALEDSRATARDTVAKLKTTQSATTADLINMILPVEFQAALAYEGLYFNHTQKLRTANLPVRFASRKEHSGEQAWADLFNNLVARTGTTAKYLASPQG